ncbi:N4-gp56 family major capsid protein [Rossellomorea aquimaris]|uniref:N4-gp56 family major capsid protein n=1 Tax=Rossellomorea aquimaris TaxID=189382 RepID=UPI0011E964CF|nr:N4-gp56 family major capsid protein [Rossellomorea aquimaris]TYS91902.1 N4-gp56 family major capsid protein [Rossellomorea aquimaris]
MAQTQLSNLVNPEVMADMISAQLPNLIRFAPLARVNNELAGRPGDTVTVPKWGYIGDAADIAEGESIPLDQMSTSTDTFSIKKAGKGVEITDEAALSGYGDPIGEAQRQLGLAIANKVDNDALTALQSAVLTYATAAGGKLDVATVDAAQQVFGDEELGSMVLIANPKDAAVLREDAAGQWARASELGDAILQNGTFGEVLGAQVVRSNKLAEGEAYLVKQGALAIYMKRGVMVESDRDIVNKTTVITADEHYGVHLADDSKAVKITITA